MGAKRRAGFRIAVLTALSVALALLRLAVQDYRVCYLAGLTAALGIWTYFSVLKGAGFPRKKGVAAAVVLLPAAEIAAFLAVALASGEEIVFGSAADFWNQAEIAFREELSTTFLWVFVAAFLLKYKTKKGLTPSSLRACAFVSGLLFSALHVFSLIDILSALSFPDGTGVFFACAYLFNAFVCGLCAKGVFVRTGRLRYAVLFHFLVNLSRGFFGFWNLSAA